MTLLATLKYDIGRDHECHAGTRKVFEWTLTDKTGAVVDITGFTFRFVIRRKGDVDKDPLLEQDDDAFTITNAAGGVVQQVITAAEMPTHGEHAYKLMATDDFEDVAARGTFFIHP